MSVLYFDWRVEHFSFSSAFVLPPVVTKMSFTLLFLSLAATVRAAISISGQTLVVNGISYYASPNSVSIIAASAEMLSSASTTGVDLIPLTVLEDTTASFTTSLFRSVVSNYTASDDVFNTGFLQCMTSQSKSSLQF